MTSRADRLVDARGLRCPWPALRAAAAMRDAADLTILVDDAAARHEIAGLAAAHGWSFRAEAGGRLRLSRAGANQALA